ncbi:hypothetical protein [Escherichia phage dw-ec]|nr:hypothetical protein [Escherichia phage BI-EHEC]UJQ43801.1 hypothetical protein [Escherichia phage dw-ec]
MAFLKKRAVAASILSISPSTSVESERLRLSSTSSKSIATVIISLPIVHTP